VCDFMIGNGNHTTTAQGLLVGLPIITLPIDSEKCMVSERLDQLGAGIPCMPTDPMRFKDALREITRNTTYRASAIAFKDRYASLCPDTIMTELVDRIENIVK